MRCDAALLRRGGASFVAKHRSRGQLSIDAPYQFQLDAARRRVRGQPVHFGGARCQQEIEMMRRVVPAG